jgi:hypothetical protein
MTYAGINTTVTVMNGVRFLKIGSNEQTSESELEHGTAFVPNLSFIRRPTFRSCVACFFRKFTILPGDPIHPCFLETFLDLWVLYGLWPGVIQNSVRDVRFPAFSQL